VELLVALATFLLTYWSNRRQSAIEAQLARVNSQLADLHEPMLSLTKTCDAAWAESFEKYGVSSDAFFGSGELPEWRREAWID